MSRIQACLGKIASARRKALIPFVTAGDPRPEDAVPIMHALVEGGADIIELGVPFSDPMADGPTIQRASERALKNGVRLTDVLSYVREFRKTNAATPVVLMGYANPIERMGVERFVADAAAAGVDGVLVVDYPPEECGDFAKALASAKLDPVFLLSPTSSDMRVQRALQMASGYLYYVSLRGVTGASHIDTGDVERMIAHIKTQTQLPIGVGFGIRDGATAKRIAAFSDAVVIGSRFVEEIEKSTPQSLLVNITQLTRSFRTAIDS